MTDTDTAPEVTDTPSAPVVQAQRSFRVAPTVLVRAGDLFPADDPLVAKHPGLFTPVNDGVRTTANVDGFGPRTEPVKTTRKKSAAAKVTPVKTDG